MKKERFEVDWRAADHWAEPIAWKRVGFKDKDDVKQKVRELPIEEKVDMLVELHIEKLAKKHFRKKVEFLQALGHKTWVDDQEVLEYIKETFKSNERTEWVIRPGDFHGKHIDPDSLQFDTLHAFRLHWLLDGDEEKIREHWNKHIKLRKEHE